LKSDQFVNRLTNNPSFIMSD